LSGCCFHRDSFNPAPALAEAFTEAELLDGDADAATRVLHTLLLAAARVRADRYAGVDR
jgi:hypothetical protein